MNLIYQYWDGTPTTECLASVERMKAYAERIGAEHIFEKDPKYVTNLGKYSPHYGQFKVIYDPQFSKYNKILFTDTDVFPVGGLTDNIFDQIRVDEDLAIAEEWQQVEVRKKHTVAGINNLNDKTWASVVEGRYNCKVPRAECGAIKAYNSGAVLWTEQGLDKARSRFAPFRAYVDIINMSGLPIFYTCDQPYIHAMMCAHLKWVSLDYRWNSSVHFVPGTKAPRPVNDLRENAAFVHVQLSGADKFSKTKLYSIVDNPVEDWNL